MPTLSLDELDDRATNNLIDRARADFAAMPGLRLNLRQAQRLWGLDAASCEEVLDALVDAGVLTRTRDYAYVLRRHCRVMSTNRSV